jgi:hypothetical protein
MLQALSLVAGPALRYFDNGPGGCRAVRALRYADVVSVVSASR